MILLPSRMQLTEEDVDRPKAEVKAMDKAEVDLVLTVALRKHHKVESDFGEAFGM